MVLTSRYSKFFVLFSVIIVITLVAFQWQDGMLSGFAIFSYKEPDKSALHDFNDGSPVAESDKGKDVIQEEITKATDNSSSPVSPYPKKTLPLVVKPVIAYAGQGNMTDTGYCGDGSCGAGEDCHNCRYDCYCSSGGGGGGGGSGSVAPPDPVSDDDSYDVLMTECNDTIDNDFDGLIDSGDPGCGPDSDNETDIIGSGNTSVPVNTSVSGNISINISLSRSSCVAPCSIFFDASMTSAAGIERPFHDLEFEWDFDDTGSTHPSAKGGVAAHVFESVGAHEVVLTVRDIQGNSSSQRFNVEIQNPEVVFMPPVGRTFCVSNSGDFTGCPSGNSSDHLDYFPLYEDSDNVAGSNRRILFRRGDVWTTTSRAYVNRAGPGHIGAYGSCLDPDERGICANAPKIISAHAGHGFEFSQNGLVTDWRISDLEMEGLGISSSNAIRAFGMQSRHLILRMHIHDFSGSVFIHQQNIHQNHDITVADSWIYNSASGAHFWYGGNNIAIIGNAILNASVYHVVRIPYAGKAFISDNVLRDPGATQHALKLHAPSLDEAFTGFYSQYVVISDNIFRGTDWYVTVREESNHYDERIRDVVVERNVFERNSGFLTPIGIQIRAVNVTVRNNIFYTPIACSIDTDGLSPSPPAVRVNIYNNLQYASYDDTFSFARFYGDDFDSVVLRNNIAVSTQISGNDARFLLFEPGDQSTEEISVAVSKMDSDNNLLMTHSTSGATFVRLGIGNYLNLSGWQSGFGQDNHSLDANPLLVNPAGDDFRLQSGSPAICAGASVPVFEDFYGNSRIQDDGFEIGIHERYDVCSTQSTVNTSGWLYTQGNKIYSDGEVWVGRGANIHDTRSCDACSWNAPDVEEVKRRIDLLVDVWGADFVRLALESYADSGGRVHWQGVLDDQDYLDDIVEIVEHIRTKQGVYVMLSLWVDPTFDSNGWPTDGTRQIWQRLASTFANESHVLFGLVNEPEMNYAGTLDAAVWVTMNATVGIIRETEDSEGSQHHIIAVQGTGGWSRFLGYYVDHPITAHGGDNIAYEVHVYDPASTFNDRFVDPSQSIPVIIGEFGPASGYMSMDDCQQLIDSAQDLRIPYLAWTFHMRCPPNLLVDYSAGGCGVGMSLEPTAWGQLLMDNLLNYTG